MRRMLRIFLVLRWMGLGLSTVLFVGTGVLWVRSLGYWEQWNLVVFQREPAGKTGSPTGWGTRRTWYAEAIHGRLWLGWERRASLPYEESGAGHWRQAITADRAKEQFESELQPGPRPWFGGVLRARSFAGAGFWQGRSSVVPETGRPTVKTFVLAIPFWMLAVVFGLWPACFAARRVFRRRRQGAGLCPQCGYDLRATPDRCPECGRPSRQRAADPSPM